MGALIQTKGTQRLLNLFNNSFDGNSYAYGSELGWLACTGRVRGWQLAYDL